MLAKDAGCNTGNSEESLHADEKVQKQEIHPGFEIQRIRSNTGVPLAPQKDLCPPQKDVVQVQDV